MSFILYIQQAMVKDKKQKLINKDKIKVKNHLKD